MAGPLLVLGLPPSVGQVAGAGALLAAGGEEPQRRPREFWFGPALLSHPGFSNNLDLWNWLVRELAPTHHCVTFDPRGHGDSDKPDSEYTLDELAEDVAAWPSAFSSPT